MTTVGTIKVGTSPSMTMAASADFKVIALEELESPPRIFGMNPDAKNSKLVVGTFIGKGIRKRVGITKAVGFLLVGPTAPVGLIPHLVDLKHDNYGWTNQNSGI